MKRKKHVKRKKHERLLQEALAGWEGERLVLERRIKTLEDKLISANHELAAIEANRRKQIAADWALYDKAQDELTAQELALFQAGPAYKKYQKYRAQRGEKAA